jgi:hypothetical protein
VLLLAEGLYVGALQHHVVAQKYKDSHCCYAYIVALMLWLDGMMMMMMIAVTHTS